MRRRVEIAIAMLTTFAVTACGGDHVTLDTPNAFGAVGSAVWIELDVDDDATGAFRRGDDNYVLFISDVPEACALIQDGIDDCADALDDHNDRTPAAQCTEGDVLLEDVADAFAPLFDAEHRVLTAYFYDDGELYDEPVSGELPLAAELSARGAAVRIDLMSKNPLAALADSWDDDSCSTVDESSELEAALEVYTASGGTIRVDRIDNDGIAGSLEGTLDNVGGASSGNVSASFEAARCSVDIRGADDAQCAAWVLPPLAFAGYGGTGTPGPDNVSACREYVAAANAAYAACERNITVNEAQTCPASINDGEDCTAYYNELRDGVACVGGEVEFTPATSTCD